MQEQVKTKVTEFATTELGLRLLGVVDSPLLGPAGNKEFLIGLVKP